MSIERIKGVASRVLRRDRVQRGYVAYSKQPSEPRDIGAVHWRWPSVR